MERGEEELQHNDTEIRFFGKKNSMNTQAEINWIAKELEQSNDPSVIQYFKRFLLSLKEKDGSSRTSIEQYNKEVDACAAQYHTGEYSSDEDFEREMKTW
jgi:hypothetical protein